MKTNVKTRPTVFTHEGAPARVIKPEQALRRSVMSCLLWEDSFYEDGVSIADRIAALVPQVDPKAVSLMAIEARTRMKLRHAPLWLALAMLDSPRHKPFVRETVAGIIQRPDELTEILAMLWNKSGKRPKMPAVIKDGIAAAFGRFNEYSLAKWRSEKSAVSLKSVLRLCHPKPKNDEQSALWKRALKGEMAIPDTWEVALSSGKNKLETWTRLLADKKLGALAMLRNLRNMNQVGVDRGLVFDALDSLKTDRVLPFRFIAAARAVPEWEPQIEKAMLKALGEMAKLAGKTLLLIDTSPSMAVKLSAKSDLSRMDAAFGLAVLCRELCDDVEIWAFSQECKMAPPRRGFALADAIRAAVPSNGTLIGKALQTVTGRYDRLICVTDEESQDAVRDPDGGKSCYLINVATSQHGIGYGLWTHLDGFSESVLTYITESERQG